VIKKRDLIKDCRIIFLIEINYRQSRYFYGKTILHITVYGMHIIPDQLNKLFGLDQII
jgi:hypothetical protein